MKTSTPNILVIRLSAMGDCALAVPVLGRLLNQHPDVQITVLTKAFFKPIFQSLGDRVQIEIADTKNKHKGFFGVLKLAKQLKHENFTQIADLHNVLRSKIIRTKLAFSGVETAVIDKGRKEKKALTRPNNKVFKALKTTPERYEAVFKALGYPIDLNRKVQLKKPKLPAHVASLLGDVNQKWIGIAPFAAHQPKTYPLELMEKVIAAIDRQNIGKILLFGGGQKEVEQLQQLEAKFDQVISVAGKLAFHEEIKLIAHLSVMLSMDSGNGHLAAMYSVPTVTLWGATHPYAGFAPFGQPQENQLLPDLKKYPLLPTSVFGNKQVEGYEEVMRSIPPEKIINRLTQLLEE